EPEVRFDEATLGVFVARHDEPGEAEFLRAAEHRMAADLLKVQGERVVVHAFNLRRDPGGSHRRNRSIWVRSQVRAAAVREDSRELGGCSGWSRIVAERQPSKLGARSQSELREDASQV